MGMGGKRNSYSSSSPRPLHMLDPALGFFHAQPRAKFKYLEMLRLNHRLERGKINRARTRRTMIAAGKLHIVDVKTGETVAQRFQMHHMIYETKVLFNLRMSCVMPVNQVRTGQLAEKQLIIALDRQLFQRLAV